MSQRPLVKNATSNRQVKFAERKQKDERLRELEDLREVCGNEVGRRVLYRILQSCSVFESIAQPLELIAYNAGRQDVGHRLMALLEQADDAVIFTMMQEATIQRRRDARERDAVHIEDEKNKAEEPNDD